MTQRKATFMSRTALSLSLAAVTFGLSGCGVFYFSPKVSQGADATMDVREIALTPQTVILANRSAYTPRNLPREFFSVASGQQGPGLGALPDAPDIPDERPGSLELRLPPEVPSEPYRIGVGDVVLLATRSAGGSVEQLSGLLAAQQQRQGYTVSDDGAISIPDMGRVEIAGLTLREAQDEIFQFLLENQVDPSFSLEVTEFNSKRVTVGGAVGSPARIPITLVPLTLNEALTGAGGMTLRDEQFASIRLYRDGSLYQLPYETYRERPDLQTLRLQDGDAVFVDTTYDLERAFAFYQQEIDVISLRNQARQTTLGMLQSEISLRRSMLEERRSNFMTLEDLGATSRDYIYLTGEVNNQGRVVLPYEQQTTLADVLYDNGGFKTETGNPSNIYVLRPSTDPSEFGAITAWHLNAANSVNLILATRMEMRPNDIVFIEEQPITKWGRALRQFFPTLINTVTGAIAQ
ncbi:MAG: polysaccharide biosynthesis/export family protein [Loktanella sp.]|nr:polysaccharide biosynthesis/export family protein [Loktanella sp.]